MLFNTLIELDKLAKDKFNLKPKYKVVFDLKSVKTLGLFRITKKGKFRIHLNKLLINDPKYRSVIVHEYAHMINRILFPSSSAHGKSWKTIMKIFGEKNPKATTREFNLGDVEVSCNCSTFKISKNRATRLKSGSNYQCKKCGGNIRFN